MLVSNMNLSWNGHIEITNIKRYFLRVYYSKHPSLFDLSSYTFPNFLLLNGRESRKTDIFYFIRVWFFWTILLVDAFYIMSLYKNLSGFNLQSFELIRIKISSVLFDLLVSIRHKFYIENTLQARFHELRLRESFGLLIYNRVGKWIE